MMITGRVACRLDGGGNRETTTPLPRYSGVGGATRERMKNPIRPPATRSPRVRRSASLTEIRPPLLEDSVPLAQCGSLTDRSMDLGHSTLRKAKVTRKSRIRAGAFPAIMKLLEISRSEEHTSEPSHQLISY